MYWVEDFARRLAGLTDSFIEDLRNLLEIVESNEQAAALFFEYSYGSLNVFAYIVNSQLDQLGETTRLPSKLRHEALFPDSLQQDFTDDEDGEEFDHQKQVVVETWISDCWDLATEERAKVHAFLSIHDSYSKTDLNTKCQTDSNRISTLLGSSGTKTI